jgi:hypothetical protein
VSAIEGGGDGDDAPPVDAGPCLGRTVRDLPLPSARGGVLAGPSVISGASCQPNAGGPEDVYLLHVAARTGVTLSTMDPATTVDTVLSVRTDCTSVATEVACNDDHGLSTRSAIRTVLDPGDYFVIVDQFGASGRGGAYLLTAAAFTPAANAACAGAVALVAEAAPLGGQDLAAGGAPSELCRFTDVGPQLFYRVTVAAGGHATVTARPTGGATTWRPVVRSFDACPASRCVADAIAPAPGMPATLTVSNPGTSAVDVVVSVASHEDPLPAGATFEVSYTAM